MSGEYIGVSFDPNRKVFLLGEYIRPVLLTMSNTLLRNVAVFGQYQKRWETVSSDIKQKEQRGVTCGLK